MLYTFLFTFRRRQYAHQIRAQSVMEAIRLWATTLDHRSIPNFGDLSKRRLIDKVNANQFGPTAVNGLTNVWSWSAILSEYEGFIHIVATTEVPS